MSTEILKAPTISDWRDVKNECRNTMGKNATDNNPSSEWKKKILLSEHSPIRQLRFKWRWAGIKSWIATHYVRHHEGIEKWISSQRTDRTGVNRDELPQAALVNMDMEANAQAIMNMARVRLCYCAAPETRLYMEDLKKTIYEYEPELSDCMVPTCVRCGGCPEMWTCHFYDNLIKQYPAANSTNIADRYEEYNKYFWRTKDE